MAIYFFDSSALVKRYVPEAGSAWVQGITDPAAENILCAARVAGAEVVSALTRRRNNGNISIGDAAVALVAFRRDFPSRLLVVEVTPAAGERAMDLAEAHGLRGYDAIHLAVAFALAEVLADPIFVSADQKLLEAADKEGLETEDPNQHP